MRQIGWTHLLWIASLIMLLTIGQSFAEPISHHSLNNNNNNRDHKEVFSDGSLSRVLSSLLGQQLGGGVMPPSPNVLQREIQNVREYGPPPSAETAAEFIAGFKGFESQRIIKEQQYGPPGGPQGEPLNHLSPEDNNVKPEKFIQRHRAQQYGPPPHSAPQPVVKSSQEHYGPLQNLPQPIRSSPEQFQNVQQFIRGSQEQYGPPTPGPQPVKSSQEQYGLPPVAPQPVKSLPEQYQSAPQSSPVLQEQYGPPQEPLKQKFRTPFSTLEKKRKRPSTQSSPGTRSYSFSFSFGDRTKSRQQKAKDNNSNYYDPVTKSHNQQQQLNYNDRQPKSFVGINSVPPQQSPPTSFQQQQNNVNIYSPQQTLGGGPPGHRFVYVYGTPEGRHFEPPTTSLRTKISPTSKPDVNYQIIFVKAPNPPPQPQMEIELPPPPEHKTLVYVLLKKPDNQHQPEFRFRQPNPTKKPTPPEVFFIKYKNKMPSTSDIIRGGGDGYDDDYKFKTEQIAEKVKGFPSSSTAGGSAIRGGYSRGENPIIVKKSPVKIIPSSTPSKTKRVLPSTNSAFAMSLGDDDGDDKGGPSSFGGQRSHYRAPGSLAWSTSDFVEGYASKR